MTNTLMLPLAYVEGDKKALKLEKHRVNMIKFRQKKKEGHSSLQTEHRLLERVMKRHLKEIQSLNFTTGGTIFQKLIAEKEALRNQNLALREQIKTHQKLRKALTACYPVRGNIQSSISTDKGWWVHFANESPSFYFNPYLHEEVYATANPHDSEFTAALSPTSSVGTFLGWDIRRHQGLSDDSVTSRVNVRKTVNCSMDRAFKIAVEEEDKLRALLKTPSGWNFTQRDEVSVQVLQEIDPYTRVMVHDIRNAASIRYVFVARSAQWELENSKRKMAFSMMIIDSEANKRSRDAERSEKVEWMTEGWAAFTLTEVSDGVIDVEYEHCAGCASNAEAGVLMAQWVQFLVRWEQVVVPANLLRL